MANTRQPGCADTGRRTLLQQAASVGALAAVAPAALAQGDELAP